MERPILTLRRSKLVERISRTVNTATVHAHWLIRCEIVEVEQKGQARAEYGEQIARSLASRLAGSRDKDQVFMLAKEGQTIATPVTLSRVAVGTALSAMGSGCPPHRSRRAELPHRAPALGSDVKSLFRPAMKHTCRGYPSLRYHVHPRPVRSVMLASAPKRMPPITNQLCSK